MTTMRTVAFITKAAHRAHILIAACILFSGPSAAWADQSLAGELKALDANVLSESDRGALRTAVREDLRRQLQAANSDSSAEWRKIGSRADWEKFRDARISRLRDSLGSFPPPPKKMRIITTKVTEGDGFRIENVVYESRPGLFVTANLYVPAKPGAKMPGILLCHSHHRPKQQDELQDMGMTWARQGCLVLVIDLLGHGERRQHPFRSAADFDGEFRVSRQDYYHRYDTGIQLHLVGDSLIGWMAWDLMRGVDLLLERPSVDPERIILLGAVAGGGDPAGVTGALDSRIAAVVPFNFGGPQPETRYPLPDDAEQSFNYAGSGGWESTRNLRLSAAGGFLHWVIVGGIAPRRLVYGHEFSWDGPRDPVWKRFQRIYGFYDASDRLAVAHGKGLLRGRPPEASHCGNIGRFHRKMIHPAFRRWFDIDVGPEDEYSKNRQDDELLAMTSEARKKLKPKLLVDVLPELAEERIDAARSERKGKSPAAQREALKKSWRRVLGKTEKAGKVQSRVVGKPATVGDVTVTRIVLHRAPGIDLPLLVIAPAEKSSAPRPAVVAVAQAGKEAFLHQRSEVVAELVSGGAIVCLPDVRDTGEGREDSSRGQYSASTARSSSALMLGQTMVGLRLGDLQAVLAYLRTRRDVDAGRLALWGDSFAPANGPQTKFRVPRRVDGRPQQAEPLGGLLALLGALFDDQVAAVYIHGGLKDFRSVLASQTVLIPHDVVVPGVLTTGDLADVAAALAPRPLRLDALVDALNRKPADDALLAEYQPALDNYTARKASDKLRIGGNGSPAKWLLSQLAGGE